jgi:FOG: TPR repeat, SEL1 subfamily
MNSVDLTVTAAIPWGEGGMINTSAPGRFRNGGYRWNGFTRRASDPAPVVGEAANRVDARRRVKTAPMLLLAAALLAACPMVAQAMTQKEGETLALAAIHGDASKLIKLMKASYAGDATAQDWLADVYGAQNDYPNANKWYRKSAAQGNADAEYNLGIAYADGYGVKQDYVKANSWYRKAAEHGNANAAYLLGRAYSLGLGVKPDKSKGTYWMQKATALQPHGR